MLVSGICASEPKLAQLKVETLRPKIPEASMDPSCNNDCCDPQLFLYVAILCGTSKLVLCLRVLNVKPLNLKP